MIRFGVRVVALVEIIKVLASKSKHNKCSMNEFKQLWVEECHDFVWPTWGLPKIWVLNMTSRNKFFIAHSRKLRPDRGATEFWQETVRV